MVRYTDDSGVIAGESRLIAAAREDAARLAVDGGSRRFYTHDPRALSLPPDALSGYELLREAHRGSQGVVYEARQRSTGRRVAIKVMRAGPLAGERAAARFTREIRVLSRLDHPNIVTIHDGGIAAGWLYLVMDYVDGRPLDDFGARLRESSPLESMQTPKSRIATVLRLFAEVCDAVHAAHLRGVIHRDLKPSNVLVVEGSGTTGELNAKPKVLDFGLAKLIEEDASPSSGGTILGQFVGSLPWASPEQAEGAHDRLDIRTDVYSLGVILFHLLTGEFPYAVHGTLRETLDAIVRSEPGRPSAAQSGALHSEIDDEIDTIVLKCLKKSPERRYQSAGELARDVRRYLAGEPIEAKIDSRWYMFKKTLRRHRALAFSTGVLSLVILMCLGLALLMWTRAERALQAEQAARAQAIAAEELARTAYQQAEARRSEAEAALSAEAQQRLRAEVQTQLAAQERDRATVAERIAAQERTQAEASRQQIEAERNRADQEARKSAAISAFLQETLASTDPALGKAREINVQELLDRAAAQLDSQFAETPEVRAHVREAVGRSYQEMGRFDEAIAQLTAALADRRERLGDKHPQTLQTLSRLAAATFAAGRAAEAEAILRESVAGLRETLGAENPQLADGLFQLAMVLRSRGEGTEAEAGPLVTEALAIRRRALGDDHPETLRAMAAEAWTLARRDDRAGGEALLRIVLEKRRTLLGEDHPETVNAMAELGWLRAQSGAADDAEALFRSAADVCRRTLGAEHPQTAKLLYAHGCALHQLHRLDEAESALSSALDVQRRVMGEASPAAELTAKMLKVVQDEKAASGGAD